MSKRKEPRPQFGPKEGDQLKEMWDAWQLEEPDLPPRPPEIRSLNPDRRRNDQVVAELAKLNYMPEPVFDLTYGRGVFYRTHRPADLTTNDLRVEGTDYSFDYWWPLPRRFHRKYATVVVDVPYQLNGKPTGDDRYGVDKRMTVEDKMKGLELGVKHGAQLVKVGGFIWVKYQDQRALVRMWWQSDVVADQLKRNFIRECRMFVRSDRAQKHEQKNPRNNYSTMEVWRRWR